MSKKIAINGFGRIGRCVLRALKDRGDLDMDVVAINDLTDAKTLAHLLKHDSVHGRWDKEVKVGENAITVAGDAIKIFAEKDPSAGSDACAQVTPDVRDITSRISKRIVMGG